MPVVSVILPTYNRLAYLREAIASVQAQSFTDWELIVVDDGSTDGTREWLAEIEDERVRVVAGPHTGRIPQLRNRGIAEARADWIAFLDSDDAWRPDKLAHQTALHAAQPAMRWSYTGRAMMDADGRHLPDERFKTWRPLSGKIAAQLLVHEAMIALPSVMMERALLDELGGFDEGLPFSTDYDMWLRAARHVECGVIDLPLIRVRIHSGSTTRHCPEVNAAFIEVYRRFAGSSTARSERRICRRQEAFYAVHLGRQLAARGRWRDAARAFAHGLRRRPFHGWAWRSAVRTFFPLLRS